MRARTLVRGRRPAVPLRLIAGLLLGFGCALLVSCGSSGKGLIPLADAGPLRGDFEEIARAAEAGNGSCTTTELAIAKTEQDFTALPPSVDAGLRNTLQVGIKNLAKHAKELCLQPLAGTTTTGTTATTTTATTTTTTATTQTTTVPPTTTPTTTVQTTTTPATSPPITGGGTAAPGQEGTPSGSETNNGGVGAGNVGGEPAR